MSPFLTEIVGTALLLLLGNGAVANVVLGEARVVLELSGQIGL
jgi:glycerol uptake facilitator-like aquaporin